MSKYSFINPYAIEKYKKRNNGISELEQEAMCKGKEWADFFNECDKAINVIKHNVAKQITVEYVKTNIIIRRNQKEAILTLLIFEFYRMV